MDLVSDVDWNPRYNMFAAAGFGQEFPILVYVYERSKEEIEELTYRNRGKLTSIADVPDLNDPQNEQLREQII